MPTGTAAAVELRGLVIDRGELRAVDGVDLVARHAEVTVVLGPNGAGKTSTVEHLEGYLPRRHGTVSVLGLDPAVGSQHRRLTARVGVMLQQGGIQGSIRPWELLTQYGTFFDHPLDPARLLDRVGLTRVARTPFRRLSGGEQQRLSLALALIGRPELVFLDEPTAGVDLAGRDLIRGLVRDLAADGTTVILTTHDLVEAEQLADHVVILDHGRVVAAGSPAELTAGEPADLRFRAASGLDTASMGSAVGVTVREVSPGEYAVQASPSPVVVAALTAWLAEQDQAIAELHAGHQRLEDVFRRLTASESNPGDGNTITGSHTGASGNAGTGSSPVTDSDTDTDKGTRCDPDSNTGTRCDPDSGNGSDKGTRRNPGSDTGARRDPDSDTGTRSRPATDTDTDTDEPDGTLGGPP